MKETEYGRSALPVQETAASGDPALIIWTGIHGDESEQNEVVAEYLLRRETHFAPTVHLSHLHEHAHSTGTRGALIHESSGRALLPGVSYVFVRQHPETGSYKVAPKKSPTARNGWNLVPMLDMNRMSGHHGTNGSMASYMEESAMEASGDPRHDLFSGMLRYPKALIVSVHEDRERYAKYYSRIHRSNGVYAYVTGTRDRINTVLPAMREAMKTVRRSQYAVYQGIDDSFDPTLRRKVRRGIILDEIDEHTAPDSSLEHWFALASHRGMTADGATKLEYPLVLTIEIPGKASRKEKSDVFHLLMEHMVAPVWSKVFSTPVQ